MPDDQNQNQQDANLPKTKGELNQIIDGAINKRVAPKVERISELEAQVQSLTGERDQFKQQVADRDEKITGLESTVGEKDRLILVNQVAHQKRVPAKYLSGDSKEELEAAADEFLADVQGLTSTGSQEKSGEPGNGVAPGGQNNGHVPSAGTGGEKPPRPTYDEIKQKAYEEAKTR